MANPNDPYAGAPLSSFGDLSKANLYGSSDEQLQELQKSQKDILSSIENRYAQPNLWKVAAGFAKPQLGGFLASFGSASEALGENVEQQRAAALPMAQIRSQMAQTNMMLNKNKDVSDEVAKWLNDPKNAGKLPSDQILADWRARAPDTAAVKSLDSQIALQQKAREQAQKNIEIDRLLNKPPNPADLEVLGRGREQTNLNKDTGQKAEPPSISKLPIDPREVKEGEKVDFGFAKIHPDAAATPLGQEKIKAQEEDAVNKLKSISVFGEPTNNLELRQNIDQVLNFAEQGPKQQAALAKVTLVMNGDNKLMNALAAAGQAGIHGNFNSLSASIGLPIKAFVDSFRDPEEKKAAQMLTLALDNANFVQAKMRGMSTTANLPAAEANLLAAGSFTRDLNYHSLIHGLMQIDNSLDMYKNIYTGHNHFRTKYASELTPYAPDYQIMKSDWYNNLVESYAKQAREISRAYNKSFNPN